jgi:ribulose-5-phosphate 4-epimerase/fuculose-1-phosphate aldolase
MANTGGIRELSARLAANRLLVQASTGNTSVKDGDTLWIKASGKWLADAASPDFLIPVALRRARQCLDAGEPIPETENNGGVCASIETAMHAVLPHKVVVHVHSVNAIAWAVRTDAPNALQGCLDGFAWQWIPYTLSGIPLARRMQNACRLNPKTDVFVLGNHGLVVCGESCELTERLLEDVEKRLHVEPRLSTGEGGYDRSVEHGNPDGLAFDVRSRTILRGGVLYPCQILFLPSTVFAGEQSLQTQIPCIREHVRALSTPVVLDKDRMVCGSEMTESQHELLLGLSQVVRRIDQSSPIRYLSTSEVSDVLQGGGQYLARAK